METTLAQPFAAGLGLIGHAGMAVAALSIALSLRPWRCLERGGPPWPWIVAWVAMPSLWCLDRLTGTPAAQLMSLAPLLVLLAGWPLTILALFPVAGATVLAGELGWVEGLHRLVWEGIVPATLMLGLGAASRRWLAHHLLVYILGRGFFGTLIATAAAGCAALFLLRPAAGFDVDELVIARLLAALGEAIVSGTLIASLVAFRPRLLATYTDRLYLPP
jgi:uncharacterized membrane protein